MLTPESKIISVPDARLRQPSSRLVAQAADIQATAGRMANAALAWEKARAHEVSVALAAVQIGVNQRLIIVRTNPEDKNSTDFQAFVNPKITKYEGALLAEPEGCLSVPDLYGQVPRYAQVRISATSPDGRPIRLRANGFLARVFQHEIDHLSGRLFVDHVAGDSFYNIADDGSFTPISTDELASARLLWRCGV